MRFAKGVFHFDRSRLSLHFLLRLYIFTAFGGCFFLFKNEESLSDDDGQEEGKVLGKKILLYSKSSKDTVGLPEIKTL